MRYEYNCIWSFPSMIEGRQWRGRTQLQAENVPVPLTPSMGLDMLWAMMEIESIGKQLKLKSHSETIFLASNVIFTLPSFDYIPLWRTPGSASTEMSATRTPPVHLGYGGELRLMWVLTRVLPHTHTHHTHTQLSCEQAMQIVFIHCEPQKSHKLDLKSVFCPFKRLVTFLSDAMCSR